MGIATEGTEFFAINYSLADHDKNSCNVCVALLNCTKCILPPASNKIKEGPPTTLRQTCTTSVYEIHDFACLFPGRRQILAGSQHSYMC